MNCLLHQDLLFKRYLYLAFLATSAFTINVATLNNIAVLPVIWFPVMLIVGVAMSNDRMTQYGAYAVCSNAVTREQYLNSKYLVMIIALIVPSAFSLAICLLSGINHDAAVIVSDLLMTMMMCMLGFGLFIMSIVRSNLENQNISLLIPLSLVIVNVLLLIFWPNELAVSLTVAAITAVLLSLVYRKSIAYVRRMSM